jgi:hypothetical protein
MAWELGLFAVPFAWGSNVLGADDPLVAYGAPKLGSLSVERLAC